MDAWLRPCDFDVTVVMYTSSREFLFPPKIHEGTPNVKMKRRATLNHVKMLNLVCVASKSMRALLGLYPQRRHK